MRRTAFELRGNQAKHPLQGFNLARLLVIYIVVRLKLSEFAGTLELLSPFRFDSQPLVMESRLRVLGNPVEHWQHALLFLNHAQMVRLKRDVQNTMTMMYNSTIDKCRTLALGPV